MTTLTISQLAKKINDTEGLYESTTGIANLFQLIQKSIYSESLKKITANFTWRITFATLFSSKLRLYFFLEKEFEIFNKSLVFNFHEGLNIIEEPVEIYLFSYSIQINSKLIPIKVLSTRIKEIHEV